MAVTQIVVGSLDPDEGGVVSYTAMATSVGSEVVRSVETMA